ncbi:hypothetical protein EF902_49415, partial [Streptomyces sp. WAC05858]
MAPGGVGVVADTQLRLARPLAADLRRPWEKPTASDRLTPDRAAGGGPGEPELGMGDDQDPGPA